MMGPRPRSSLSSSGLLLLLLLLVGVANGFVKPAVPVVRPAAIAPPPAAAFLTPQQQVQQQHKTTTTRLYARGGAARNGNILCQACGAFCKAVRGCALLAPSPLVNVIGAIQLIKGFAATVGPDVVYDAYGIKDATSQMDLMMDFAGAFSLALGILTFGAVANVVAKGATIAQVVATSQVPILLCLLRAASSGALKDEFGVENAWALAYLPLMAVIGYGAFFKPKCCLVAKAVKVIAALFAVEGAACMIAPKKYFKLASWTGLKELTDQKTTILTRWVGASEAQYGVFMLSLLRGVAPVTALGYSLVPKIAFALVGAFGPMGEDLGIKKPSASVLIAVEAICAAAFLCN